MIKMVIGLANPGERYAPTRHNAGAWFIQALVASDAAQLQEPFKSVRKLKAQVARLMLSNHLIRLAIPSVYMNESGDPVQRLCQFYNLATHNLLIAHDDIDLHPGQIKLKFGGGHGGHNGLRHILQALGNQPFYRLRIGVGHPGRANEVVNYVLKPPNLGDQQAINSAINESVSMMPQIILGEIEVAMNRLHSRHRQ